MQVASVRIRINGGQINGGSNKWGQNKWGSQKLNNHPLKTGGLESLAAFSRDTGRIAPLEVHPCT